MRRVRAIMEDLTGWVPYLEWDEAQVALLAGDTALAEVKLRRAYEALRRTGEKSQLSTLAIDLADVLYLHGHHEDAEEFTRVSKETAAADDLASQIRWRTVQAKVLAREGRTNEADRLAHAGVALAERTDYLSWRAAALMDLATVLWDLSRPAEANARAREAIVLFEQKGNVAAAQRAQRALTSGGRRPGVARPGPT